MCVFLFIPLYSSLWSCIAFYFYGNLYIALLSIIAVRKKVTLSLDDRVFGLFRTYCKNNDIQLSKRVERLIKQELESSGGAHGKRSA